MHIPEHPGHRFHFNPDSDSKGFRTGVLKYSDAYYGSLPIFSHAVDDLKTFRMITSQLYVNGSAKQADICRAFGVSRISVKRSVKLYREKGAAGFFEPRRRRGPAVLPPEVLQKVQFMLDNDDKISEIANELNLKADTLRKAISSGKLHKPQKKTAADRDIRNNKK